MGLICTKFDHINFLGFKIVYRTCKILTRENIDKFDEFPAIRQYFPYQIFRLVSYLYEMNE